MKPKIEAERVDKAYKQFKKALNPREKEVLTKYYGLDSQVRHSLNELGETYQVTRERIRQIKVEALRKVGLKKTNKK
jgi:RNA polymerase primary sigma factor